MSSWLPWKRAPAPDPRRWVVVDVESSGLDAARDRLLAIAAIAVHLDEGALPRIVPADSFEVVLRQDETVVDKPNILVHGIGVGAQRAGVEPRQAMSQFEDWLGASPLVAFHAAFDETMIQRAMKAVLGHRLPNPWLDLEPLARIARPAVKARALDDWLALTGLHAAVRHQAASDALVTAQLMQVLWPALVAQREPMDFTSLRKRTEQARWLGLDR
jgi:DNA polymerase-3 subunit epsilon